MHYVELDPLPNTGFVVAANFYGVIGQKILLAGGSGFKTPLAEGGKKLLSDQIILVSETNSKWTVHDEISLVLNGEPYGFCNGASIMIDHVAYFIGGFKFVNQKMVDSADIVRVWVSAKNKINYQIYEDVLPFKGKTTGVKFGHHRGFLTNGDNAYWIDFGEEKTQPQFSVTKVDTNDHLINGSLVVANNGSVYLINAYKPFNASDHDSNRFLTDQLLSLNNAQIHAEKFRNFSTNPCTFLDGSALWKNDHQLLVIGGVDEKMFCDAVKNLSTLKGDELTAYRQAYFNKSEAEFKFCRQLVLFDLVEKNLTSLGEFNHGFAGNPVFVQIDDQYYILSSEVKAGVRLTKPIKFTL